MIEKKKNSNLGITKAPKGVAGMAKLMSQGMAPVAAKNLLKKIRENKPSGRISQFDIKEALDKLKIKMPKRKLSPAKMPNQPNFRSKPEKPKALGPVRPIRERSLSKLISRRRGMNKR